MFAKGQPFIRSRSIMGQKPTPRTPAVFPHKAVSWDLDVAASKSTDPLPKSVAQNYVKSTMVYATMKALRAPSVQLRRVGSLSQASMP
jgi:hypothetical protein